MRASNELLFSNAIESIYDSTLNPSFWGTALKLAGRVSNSLGNHFLIFNSSFAPQVGAVHSTYGQEFAVKAHQAYMNDYAHLDHQRVTNFLRRSDGKAYRNDHLIGPDELKNCEVHNVYNREYECQKQLLFANRLGSSSFLTVCGSRPNDSKLYSSEEVQLFERVAHHITQSMSMQLRYGELFGSSNNLREIINSNQHSVFFMDHNLHLLWCNDTGERLLNTKSGLSIQLGRLNSKDLSFNSSLEKLIKQACFLGGKNKIRPGFALYREDQKSYSATVLSSPIENLMLRDSSPIGVLVLKEIDETSKLPPFELVAKYFHLTPAETNLALGIAGGQTVKEYATCNGITENTARSTLKIVLNKTGSKRQAELAVKLRQLNTT